MINTQGMNPAQLRAYGLSILSKELGVVGMVRFLQQFESGYGDYTKERHELFKDETVDSLAKQLGAPTTNS